MMNSYKAWCLALASMVLVPYAAKAQQRPTTQQAQQMMQNPALLEQLKQRILSSGLTPEQVRARLRAEGYPENLLDAYLPGGAPVSDSSLNAEDVFAAVAQLGIADTTEVQLLRCGVNPDTLAGADTIGVADTAAAKRRNATIRSNTRALCLAREDSARLGLLKKKAEADSGFTIFGL